MVATPRGPVEQSIAWIAACVALIVMAGLAAYSNSFSGIFVFDDEPAIARNANLASLWPLSRAITAPKDTTLAGRPFATFTFAVDQALSGGTLQAYHRTNLAIHLVASLLVFGVVRSTLQRQRAWLAVGEAATALGFGVALLFAVHPLQTGSVTYIVQRVESLMGLLYLATLFFSIRALDDRATRPRTWALAAIVACTLGMATKEVMATAPIMVYLWDRQFSTRTRQPRRLLYSGLAASWLVLVALVFGEHRSASVGLGFEAWPWWRYLITQAGVLRHYLWLSVFPSPLVLDYDWPPAGGVSEVLGSAMLVVFLLALTVRGLIRRSPASFVLVWFFLILAPTSSVLPIVTEVAAEHRMYLPLAGVLSVIVVSGFLLTQTLSRRLSERMAVWPGRLAFLALLWVALLFGTMTYARNADYHDYDRIWADTIAKRPLNARARNNYASSLLTQGRFAEAETHLRVAVQTRPDDPEAQANLGVALSALGKLAEGAEHLTRAVALKPDYGEAYRNLGENHALRHQLKEAATAYLQALQTLPDDVRLLNRASWILATAPDPRARDGERARGLAARAVELSNGRDATSLDSLGAALAELGNFEGAISAVQRAILAARARGDETSVPELQSRAAHYAQRQKFRSPELAPGTRREVARPPEPEK